MLILYRDLEFDVPMGSLKYQSIPEYGSAIFQKFQQNLPCVQNTEKLLNPWKHPRIYRRNEGFELFVSDDLSYYNSFYKRLSRESLFL